VWRYDGVTWTQVNTDGFGDAHNTGVSSLAIYNTNLYGGTWNLTTGGEVWQLQLPLPTSVPATNQWGTIILSILLAGTGSFYHLRRKGTTV
jgi:hypothetical protein